MTTKEYIEKYGEQWYLRDFDFLPEKLSYRIEYDKYYNFSDFVKGIEKGDFILFNNEAEAIRKSIKIRNIFGLNNNFLYEKLGRIDYESTNEKRG